MKVTVNDIRSIAPGETKRFVCDSAASLRSSATLAWYCNRVNRPANVKRYRVSSDYETLTLTVRAIKKEQQI